MGGPEHGVQMGVYVLLEIVSQSNHTLPSARAELKADDSP